MPLLMIGGLFLCYEGFEKIVHAIARRHRTEDAAQHRRLAGALADPRVDMVAFEKSRIRGAVRTDFILSAEIITITLGTVAAAAFGTRVAVLIGIALIMTVGVYGLVAGIVKLDDAGLALSERPADSASGRIQRALGAAIVRGSPYLMKVLSIAGTAAMFLVGGGILTHGVPVLHRLIVNWGERAGDVPGVGAVTGALAPMLVSAVAGIAAGAVVYAVLASIRRLRALKTVPAD
jgi:predicted DNA repair protein MutK